jgi:hypothetical protein
MDTCKMAFAPTELRQVTHAVLSAKLLFHTESGLQG